MVAGAWRGVGGTVQASNVVVDASSRITADGQGYTDYQGPGGAPSNTYAGGSYGGHGYTNPKPTYGSATNPVDLGSGGG